ncbi:MAG: hypothetical protein GWN17_00195, partial [Candidatus Korarchaeota archaeon]|nr:hypothetical protein [Candidatus Korarchaeota archaeon]
MLAAEKAFADDKVVSAVARNPKLRKGFNLLQDAIADSRLGGKAGKITDAKVARKQPPGKPAPKALPARLDRKKGKGFEIVKKAL